MNVEIGAEAALFPEKEYINGIAIAVHSHAPLHNFGNTQSCLGIGLEMRFFGASRVHIRFTGGSGPWFSRKHENPLNSEEISENNRPQS
jgi:hypothetical protein